MGYYLRDIECGLPPGFRFHPNDEELVSHYLYEKVMMSCNKLATCEGSPMVEVDLHTHEPWQLPEVAKMGANDWYFFSIRDRKYATGSRTNRATKCGYWKATGKDREVYGSSSNETKSKKKKIVGMRKTLVFYHGRAPNGIKSNWVMHEFRLENNPISPPSKEDWVLCRVFHKKMGEEEMKTRPCHSPSMVASSHSIAIEQPLQRDEGYGEIGTSIPSNSSGSPIGMANMLTCNYFNFTPEVGMGSTFEEYGFLLDSNGIGDSHGMEYGNLGDFGFHMDGSDDPFSSKN